VTTVAPPRKALLILAWLALAAAPLRAAEIDGELLDVLRGTSPEHEIPILIGFSGDEQSSPTVSIDSRPARHRSELIVALHARADASQRRAGAVLRGRTSSEPLVLWATNTLAIAATPQVIRELASLPEVTSIRLDGSVTLERGATGAAATAAWNLTAVGAPELWATGHRGAGAVVALLDSGVDAAHVDLAGRFRGGANSWFDPAGRHATPHDTDGHGTQAAGLLVGERGLGVAPAATWIAAKIFDDSGTATLSAIHQAFQWLLDPDDEPATDDAPDVVNGSWGFASRVNECYREFEEDIAVLRDAGIVAVFAAGNDGPANFSSVSPANNPGSVAVGAVNEHGLAETTSSRGPSACGGVFPHLVAPGVDVETADLTFGGIVPNSRAVVTGSSFAAPHAAGVAVLLRGAYPHATPDQLVAAMYSGALDLGDPGADNAYGHGLVDAERALAFLGEILGPAPCHDLDGDGYYPATGCRTPIDCNDDDPATHPGASDPAGDGTDQNCDGADATRARVRPHLGPAVPVDPAPTVGQTVVYTDETAYLAALAAGGYSTLIEDFESTAWDGVRSTVDGPVDTAPSVTSNGITWSARAGISTNNLFPVDGSWRVFDSAAGDPDRLVGASDAILYGLGGWLTSTTSTTIRVVLDGTPVDGANLAIASGWSFLAVIAPTGFTSFEIRDTDATPLDPKQWFADAFTFGSAAVPRLRRHLVRGPQAEAMPLVSQEEP
jgi:bacillopeptidase F